MTSSYQSREETLKALEAAGQALIFQIIGVTTASWMTAGDNPGSSQYGLWKSCSNLVDVGCLSYGSDVTDWMNACRAFGILGILLLVGCCLMGVLSEFSDNNKLPLMGAALSFAAGVCIVIELAVYASKVDICGVPNLKYGLSFVVTIFACIYNCKVGVWFLISRRGYKRILKTKSVQTQCPDME